MKKQTPLFLLFFALAWSAKSQGTLLDAQFTHDDSMRTYKLYVPAAYDGSEPWPLVINLHAFGWDADFMMLKTGMNAVADTGHFLVAYPQGLMVTEEIVIPPLPATGTGWNLGNFEVSGNDDVGFLSKMIHKIGLSHRVDPARVYACGFSNGGSMVYRLACELSDRIAAVASVSGGAAEDVPCSPARPVPLLEIHGTADPFNPYDGIPDFLTPIPEGINFWVNNNQCDDAPVVTQFPDVYPGDGTTVTLKKYGNCNEDAEVWLMDVLGGGHLWPDPTPPFPAPPFLGPQNGDIDGSSEIWNFFKKHKHPNPAGILLDLELTHNDSLRTYKLYVPAAYDGSEPWPLVIVLHGYTVDADFMISATGMNAVADTGHFLVAYPQGLWAQLLVSIPPFPDNGTGWNSGGIVVSGNDDVGFLSQMIHKIGLSAKVDPARVFACGLSNGGYMSYRLACELSDRIAAVASVSALMPTDVPCSNGRPVPLMEIHGTADPIVPFDGIPPYNLSIPDGIAFWVNHNGCDAAPAVIQLPDLVTTDNSTVTVKSYGNCDDGAEVLLYETVGAGHAWPTPYAPFTPPFLGPRNADINASTEIWNFFKKFEHPNPVITARVQFIHAAGHETVKLVGNGEMLREVFAYQTATPFMDVPAGAPLDLDVVVRDPWSPAPDEHFSLDFTPGETYVVLLKGTFDLNDAYPVGLSTFDRGREFGSQPDMVDLLSVRGGPDIPVPIDVVVVGGPKLADDVLYGEFGADYVSLPAGSFTLSPTPANNNDIILDPFVAHMGFWKGRTAVGFGTGFVGNGTFRPWVALSNGGTFPLYPPPGSNKPQLAIGKNSNGSLQVAPNPASHTVQVQLTVTEEAVSSSLALFDASGKAVLEMDLGELPVGYLPVNLDISRLENGVYFLKYRNGTAWATERLAVIRK